MEPNQPPWPYEWLMTDERLGERLWSAIRALPPGAGIVFRHYATPEAERIALAGKIAGHCRAHGLTLAVARDVALASRFGAELVHNPAGDPAGLPISRSAHDARQAAQARRAGATLVFISPIYSTRSHPSAPPLGLEQAIALARIAGCRAIALGGVNRANFPPLQDAGFYGWAGIDAWL